MPSASLKKKSSDTIQSMASKKTDSFVFHWYLSESEYYDVTGT